ncbi:MAG TPA: hypothetical protein VJN21_02700 [Candidatus Acidoferrales bacterium]|nr:hypothetical protein [Candidatus Acidoferrales bacterium]
MSRIKSLQLLVLALAMALSLPAFASSKHKKSDPKPLAKSTFQLVGEESLGGTVLKAGSYLVTADESKISFWRDDRLVAEASIVWKELREPPQRNTLVLDSGKIVEVRFPGKNRSVVVD